MPVPGNYTYAQICTKSDTVDVPQLGNSVMSKSSGIIPYFDAVYCGGAGVVAFVLVDGTVQNFTVVAGEIIPLRGRRVNSTNTTATLMVALYYL